MPPRFDPYQPYGQLAAGSCRIATWNVWGRFGDWAARQVGLLAELGEVTPDIVCLQESWETETQRQADVVGDALGLSHRAAVADWPEEGWRSGAAVLSRWPVTNSEFRRLPGDGEAPGSVLLAVLDGPRGPVRVFNTILDHPLHGSGVRQAQVHQLLAFVADQGRRDVTVVCGDFNAGPDSDEIRLIDGRSRPPVDGLVCYDAWEVAGAGGPGLTWDNLNPLAAMALLPGRRIDYVFSAWPRRGGAGHPLSARLLGAAPEGGVEISDHYGLCADLRY
ncbi:MAG TPA: endonuclease/exonuclease/phosphatase family protein [Pseudonocardia sp.]|nr:endonuclease/exonuclease/phosphatase family protein [Pseudonocardia sp.]